MPLTLNEMKRGSNCLNSSTTSSVCSHGDGQTGAGDSDGQIRRQAPPFRHPIGESFKRRLLTIPDKETRTVHLASDYSRRSTPQYGDAANIAQRPACGC